MEQRVRFGERLRHYRESAGYSQEELAERAGLSANAISALERGERKRPFPDTLRRLADALGLSEAARSELAASLRSPDPAPATTAPVPISLGGSVDELPDALTPLIGRDREAEVVRHLLLHAEGRLLTLIGPGGVGKTRLALHMVRTVRDDYPDGVVWVDLAPLGSASLVLPTIARAVGVEAGSGGDVRAALRAALCGRRLLLAVDNVEHVLDAATELGALLQACPDLAMLTTSRAPLNIRGEQEYVVPPLELPPNVRVPVVADIAAVPAVQLFVWHARQRDPSFVLSEENAATVVAICRRLDGVPLALELAAARVKLLGTADLLARLDHALPVLAGGPRDLPERQRTMEGAIRWSYDLLKPAEQALFRRLSVFAGGWTLEAAATEGAESADEVLDRLGGLIEQSLVSVTHEAHETRYRMLEPIRQYAMDRLEERGEAEEMRRRHARYYLVLAERAAQEIEGRSDQVAWLDRLDREHDNLRAALAWSEQDPDGTEVGLRLASVLWRFWEVRGHASEGGKWLDSALARSNALPPELRAKALSSAGRLARRRADNEQATTYQEQSLEIWRQLGDRQAIAWSLNDLGVVARDRGEAERTIQLCQESLALFREVGDQHGAAIALISLGMAASQQGDYERARSCYEESLALFRKSGDSWHIASVQNYLARLMIRQGDLATARCTVEKSLGLHRAAGDAWGTAISLSILGRIAQADHDLGTAVGQFAEGLRMVIEAGVERAIPGLLEDMAGVAFVSGLRDRAARMGGAAELLREIIGVPRSGGDGAAAAVDLSELRTGPHATAWAEGRTLTREQVVAEAMALVTEVVSPANDQPSCSLGVVPAGAPTTEPSASPHAVSGLTAREAEVLHLLAAGKSNSEIAETLFISPRTAQTHVTNILAKLGASSRTEAAIMALRDGLV